MKRARYRDFAQRPPRPLPEDSAIEPVLPIVLTERNLSATRFDQHHPSSWSPADGVVGLARESCQWNLPRTTRVSIFALSGSHPTLQLLQIDAPMSVNGSDDV